jgi:hypothetical protein
MLARDFSVIHLAAPELHARGHDMFQVQETQ